MELLNTIGISQVLTQSGISSINIQWILENRIQSKEMHESGWNFQINNTMKKSFFQTGELNGSSYVKLPLRSSALTNKKNEHRYCLLWPILAKLHPISHPKTGHSTRVSNYRQYFNELNINGFRCSDVHKFENINTLSVNIFELNISQDQKIWKHKLLTMEVSKNISDRVIDL